MQPSPLAFKQLEQLALELNQGQILLEQYLRSTKEGQPV
jgi:hypothetical protein